MPGPLLERVLAARGLADPAAAERFLSPTLAQLHDPSSIPDLDRAADRLLGAVRRGERIAIYGDYDVDGSTASAILYHTLCQLGASPESIECYVPHRVDEGYGLHTPAIEELASRGAAVIVSVDCGVTAIEPARAARSLGIDLIITDHHTPPASLADLPDAFAVVHPARPDSRYPFAGLCGAGVAFKLAWRLATLDAGGDKASPAMRSLLLELLALVALGTIADVVPLIDENRAMTRAGLDRLRNTRNPGLNALIEASGLAGEKLSCDDVGFRLAPRLNACGRLGHARETVELLTTAAGTRAAELAAMLSGLNDRRRAIERRITDRACEIALAAGMCEDTSRAIVAADQGWHPGVVGIACSRLVDRFCRPTILLCREGDTLRGSARSVDGFNLHDALAACAEHLTSFGGHDMAAGLALDASRLEAFTEAFADHARRALADHPLVPTTRYDSDASLNELTPTLVERLERLAPFGRANPGVVLRLDGLPVQSLKPFGRDGSHLNIVVGPASRPLRLVAWGFAEHAGSVRPGQSIDALVRPKTSTWSGNTRVEPELLDFRVR